MGHTALILGDQLVADNPALDGAQRVLFIKSHERLCRLVHEVHRAGLEAQLDAGAGE